MAEFEVTFPEGGYSITVDASDAEDAAEKAVEKDWDDSSCEYDAGRPQIVLVRSPAGTTSKWEVSGEAVMNFYARIVE